MINDKHIKFINRSQSYQNGLLRHSYPLFLFSYGGGGNTMTRLLLEYITNVWTGSIFMDLTLRGFK